ncbi:acyl-CoA dehydrogenase [Prauserella marina]|uniref:Acyl-CoA dehydrogenase n=1 Tax=Prauserella marina TaxID=530584 RepID=A0A222VQR5_9PSEU|nr:acyl-CoA dehydrogenase family protein [Prauserella marina]ASR36276.1 acyl-CoA dehydrogenase [Prauserella marina]PWV77052.1 alkylation response protein AidB-like acyl-CoA dehydrogenase [Prauserella marina]SDD03289.1 Acyl-CoA dehydrogenase [Prauserella marina]
MPLAVTDDQRALADAAAAFATRAAPVSATRAAFAACAKGEAPAAWPELVRQGLHAVHLPEALGGAGAGLAELAVVAEQLGGALFPGPYLPTVLTSAVLAGADGDPGDALASLAEGATGALVVGEGLVATPAGDGGWLVDGQAGPVLGLPGAEIVVARAAIPARGKPAEPAETLWFVVAEGASATVTAADGVDLTRAVGTLSLHEHRVPPARVLPSVPEDYVRLAGTALLAAEASGIAAWCLRTAVEYVKTRIQFGKPVGAFQAVQHKAAMMLVGAERASASAWDAARAASQPPDQWRLAAGQAALTALPLAVDLALDCVTLLGGIGFTWEHDVHLYWRRAISIAALAGSAGDWETALGEAALAGTRDFSAVTGGECAALRAEVGAVLDEVAAMPDEAERRIALAEAGLVAPHYPVPYGRAAGAREQAVIAQEFAARNLAAPTTVIGEWVLPTILAHGGHEQQDRFVRPTLRGELVWCQLFSEPGAGSDLASLRTRAKRVEGGWSLSGQKVWNSLAHKADWGVCLARTDPDAAKHRGLSYFLVDMRSPGVDVRPLRQATGESEFNEVFLDEVFVPGDCLVGDEGAGWTLAVTTLSNERLSMGSTLLNHGSAARFRELLNSPGSRADVVRALGRASARELSLSALNLKSVLVRLADGEPGPEASVLKVYSAIAQREGSRELLTLLGHSGAVASEPVMDHIGLPAVLLGGGTIEIQLTVLATRVLGLPR